MVIAGIVTLSITNSNGVTRRSLARILQTATESDEFEVKVEMEAVRDSSAPLNFGRAAIAAALLGGAVAVVAM